ncbi:hypothetical protein FWF89_03660 [Candidatus Saccharibacteria bacterium]|nr:hypothetical protein [Candidatus Saccharibacteria bacterium]
MLVLSLIGWWYGVGFATRLRGLGRALARTADNFSIGLMLRTLFNPFRQIDAGATGKGIAEALSAFVSRLISRLVGFVMRLGMIIVGTVVLLVLLVGSLVIIVLHLVVPLLPIAGIVMLVIGWVPEIQVVLTW